MAHPTRTPTRPVRFENLFLGAGKRVVVHDVSWSELEKFLSSKGDSAVPRVTYLDGTLELMSPGNPHELYKKFIGFLVETYMVSTDIEFHAIGSWTVKNRRRRASKEPDECYVFGPWKPNEVRPDLAIEIAWTRGGIKLLDVYRRLGVPEVWIWKRDKIYVHVLVGDNYEERTRSECLPELDLELICKLAKSPTMNVAHAGLMRALAKRR